MFPTTFQYPKMPKRGDFGESVCSKQFCEENGLHKCPFDPFCVYRDYLMCKQCPNGTTIEVDCTKYSNRSDYEKCGSKRYQKYYKKVLRSCNNEIDCPEDGRDEQHCNNNQDCKNETRGYRPIKFPFDNVCVEIEERKCTCPSGCNQTISNQDCQKVLLTQGIGGRGTGEIGEYGPEMTFVKCDGSNKCILKSKMCDGVQDCPNNEDELNCTKRWCEDNNKWMCPSEKRCIEKTFLADGDPETKFYETRYSQMQRNKCMKNKDEENIFYIDKCHQKNNYVCPKKNEPLEGINDHCVTLDQSCIPEQTTNITNYIKKEAELHPEYLWQCTPNHHEHIFLANVCNDILDCYASGFNDESDLVCERLSFFRALAWSFGIVFGIALLRF